MKKKRSVCCVICAYNSTFDTSHATKAVAGFAVRVHLP